ncbi:hypothetical protein ACX801_12845 [Arthrobacter bambusae]
MNLAPAPRYLSANHVFLDQDGAALQIDVAGVHSDNQVQALVGVEVVPLAVDPQQQDHECQAVRLLPSMRG